MSSTKRGAVREKNDFYETPADAVRPVMEELRRMWGDREVSIIDAGAGMGALTRSAREHFGAGAHILAVEQFPEDMPLERPVSMFEDAAVRAQVASGQNLYAARLHAAGANVLLIEDFTHTGFPGVADIVVSNPPFSIALEFLQHTIEVLRPEIAAFLLRLNFLGSLDRAPWFEQHPPRAIRVLVKRPDFTGTGGDSIEYAWMFWGEGVPEFTSPIGWYR